MWTWLQESRRCHGVPILRLVAVQDGLHTVALRLSGLDKNESYRITAWIRPQAEANFAIGARDQADKDNGPKQRRLSKSTIVVKQLHRAQGNIGDRFDREGMQFGSGILGRFGDFKSLHV